EGALERGINEAGISRFLRKPWKREVLASMLDQAMQHSRLRREHAAALERLRNRNDEFMGAIRRLAGGVAHEINNPLHGILSFVQLAQKGGVAAEKLQRYHEVIYECAIRCRD